MNLTDTEVKKLSLPPGKSDLIALDDRLTGFGFRIRGGKKKTKRTWIIVYRDAAYKSQKFTIGTAEELNAAKARDIAKDKLAGIRLGTYPHVERQKARDEAEETFETVSKRYLAARAGGKDALRERSLEEVTRHIEKHWAPLARASIHHIDRRSVANRMGEIAAKNGPVAANRARSTLSAMFAWAIGEGIVDSNPVIGTNKAAEETSRERVLTDAELADVWAACRDDDYGRIVRLLLLTGQRRDEVGSMRWSELDLDGATWTLPGERTKNGRAHVVPLAPRAVDILKAAKEAPRLPRPDGTADFVFGEGQGGFSGWSRAKERLDQRIANAGKPLAHWTLHDLRRTAATVMADKLAVLPHVIEALLNHVSGHKAGVAGVYNRAPYERDVRTALLTWADHVRAIVEAGDRKIIPFGPVAS
jgi:integrase